MKNYDKIFLTFALILFGISIVYLSKGFYNLLIANDGTTATDLFARWLEQEYIYRGEYPYYARPGTSNVIKELGPVNSGGYPPWSFFTGILFFPGLSIQATRFYHGLLNFISIIILIIFSYQVTSPSSRAKALFAVASSLAISSNCTTLNVGQYGIIINALLISVYWTLQQNKLRWAGLLFSLAMVKPNISALYFFIFLIGRKYQAVWVSIIYSIGATLVICLITQMSPMSMIEDIFNQFDLFAMQGTPIMKFLINQLNLKIEPRILVLLLGGLGIISVVILFSFFRWVSLLSLFAIACVLGRICIYHLAYDNVMLVFLLLAFLRITYQAPKLLNIIIFTLLGLSLWLPAGLHVFLRKSWTSSQFLIWLIALGCLLFNEMNQKNQAATEILK